MKIKLPTYFELKINLLKGLVINYNSFKSFNSIIHDSRKSPENVDPTQSWIEESVLAATKKKYKKKQ